MSLNNSGKKGCMKRPTTFLRKRSGCANGGRVWQGRMPRGGRSA